MAKGDTWMPFYIGDYLADTMRLTTIQHGAYMLLMMEYWRQGPLPDDDSELAAIAKMERKQWDKDARSAVRRFFVLQDDGLLHQKRLDAERAKTATNIEQKSAAGKASAEARAAAKAERSRTSEQAPVQRPFNGCSTGVATEDQRLGNPSPSPSPVSSDEDTPSLRSGGAARACRLPDGWMPSEEDCHYAANLGLNPDAVAENFRGYWQAKAGKDATKAGLKGWALTWQGWCRREAERTTARRPAANATAAGPKDKTNWDAHDARVAELERQLSMQNPDIFDGLTIDGTSQ